MRDDLTEIVCVVDRSGSMGLVRAATIQGFNNFLDEQRKVAGDANLTLILFNHMVLTHRESVPIQSVTSLDNISYVPDGTTALLDAMGRAIDGTGKRLSLIPEANRPGKVMVMVLTDGLENASREYNAGQIADMVKHQQDVYKWKFLFLGANMDAIAEAGKLNIQMDDSMTFQATHEGTRTAFASASSTTARYRTDG